MVQGVVTAALCLLLLALAHQGAASRPGRSMVALDLAEESTVAQLRFEAGDPACERVGFVYRCGDASLSIPTPGIAVVEGTPVLFESYRLEVERSDCGPLGKHKYRCVPPQDVTTAPVDVASAVVDSSPDSSAEGEGYSPSERSDCGPLGKHKYRCVPPQDLTTAPVEVASAVVDSSPDSSAETEAYYPSERSDCGPLGKHKYRCDPPLR